MKLSERVRDLPKLLFLPLLCGCHSSFDGEAEAAAVNDGQMGVMQYYMDHHALPSSSELTKLARAYRKEEGLRPHPWKYSCERLTNPSATMFIKITVTGPDIKPYSYTYELLPEIYRYAAKESKTEPKGGSVGAEK